MEYLKTICDVPYIFQKEEQLYPSFLCGNGMYQDISFVQTWLPLPGSYNIAQMDFSNKTRIKIRTKVLIGHLKCFATGTVLWRSIFLKQFGMSYTQKQKKSEWGPILFHSTVFTVEGGCFLIRQRTQFQQEGHSEPGYILRLQLRHAIPQVSQSPNSYSMHFTCAVYYDFMTNGHF